jgi:gamma-glutamyltranspeptidase
MSQLGDRGYQVRNLYDFGDIQMIYVDDEGVQAASDPRNRGESRVFELAVEAVE